VNSRDLPGVQMHMVGGGGGGCIIGGIGGGGGCIIGGGGGGSIVQQGSDFFWQIVQRCSVSFSVELITDFGVKAFWIV
jgi:hypothetical protein